MRIRKRLFPKWICLSICLSLVLNGCAEKKRDGKKETGEIVIPTSFLVNPDTGENENEELVAAFNQAYEGRYRVEVDWISDTAEGYRSRIKMLNGLDKLPAILTDIGFDEDFYRLLVNHERLVDLQPYMEKEDEWQEAYDERVLEVCRETDGRIFMAPGGTRYSYAGFFYNKELFEKAGISEFPTDWTEFFDCLEKLKEKGMIPLAIHGGGSYWTPLLIATNYMARNSAGRGFLKQQYPQNYRNASVFQMFRLLKKLYSYTDADALEIERIESAQRFAEGKNAITANGGWMISNFTKQVKQRTGFAPFPGNILMQDPKMSAWAIAAGYSQEVTEGAAEFLKFRAMQKEKFPDIEKETTLEREYREAVEGVREITPNYQLKWESEIQEEFFVNELPLYVEEKISTAELVERLNQTVWDINKEK